MERRLAALLMADVVGYSRLMEEDESGTLAALTERRASILVPTVIAHGGRVVKLMGDGMLIEFGSAINAVAAAVDVQRKMAAANALASEKQRIDLRIGINLGDVIGQGTDVFGEGVNIAARLEALADPGGICVSGKIHDEVRNKVACQFEDMGEQKLKNISTPVRAFRLMDADPPQSSPAQQPRTLRSSHTPPSLAVLPFTNMSSDLEQRYFSDGLTEDIITELARFRDLHVIARNSSFRYRGGDIDIVRVGRELGVQYILEGSVRRLGDRIRITAQLVETSSGNHLWAERFDRNQDEIFAVQDQVIRTIVGTLIGRLKAVGVERALRKPPASLEAYECVLRADALPFDNLEPETEAVKLYERAIELDPHYGRAYGLLANLYLNRWSRDLEGDDEKLSEAFELSRTAVALDPTDPICQLALGWAHLYRQSFDLSGHHFRKAHELAPNKPVALTGLGFLHHALGKPAEAIGFFIEARVVDPYFEPTWYWPQLGCFYFSDHKFDEAIANLSRSPQMPYWVEAYRSACYALMGKPELARECASNVLRKAPNFSSIRFVAKEGFQSQTDEQLLLEGLSKAGLPE
ncbi:adenylate class-3/4/guanylyl cyclase [Mesorhizobium sp. M0317]|uniref:adenylate/guanylate cyclase domain-containing protein n=1 Tax=Mesorhizobium sp. M0317 TaxID=2956935 RepID=UPI00333A46FA